MSPDGKWIWDGAQWRPIAVHEAAFPNWKSVGAGFVPETDTRAQPVAMAPPRSTREAISPPSYRLAGPAPNVAAPLWRQASAGLDLKRYGRMAIAAVALVVVIVLVSVVATLALSARQNSSAPVVATTSKGGPTARSDSALAAYVIKSLETPMADLRDNSLLVRQTCAAGMTSSCWDSVTTMDNNLTTILPILDKATIPLCISVQEGPLRTDLTNLRAEEQLALKGFNDGKKSEFLTGYAQVVRYGPGVQTEFAAVKSAAATCDSAVTGP